MVTPEKLAKRVQLYLQPGEEVRQAFLGQRGPSPYAWVVMWLLAAFVPLRIVVVTDRAILLLRASKLPYARPKALRALLARLPRQMQLGPVRGAWSRVRVGPEELWVSRPFHRQVTAADEALNGPLGSEAISGPLDPRGGGSANVLLPLGLFAAIIGGWDASTALGDQERFLGALFALGGLSMLAAGICLLSSAWRDEWGRPLGIIAGVAGILVGLYFAVTQLGFPGDELLGFPIGRSGVFWFGVAAMLVAAVAIWRLPRPDEPTAADTMSDGGSAATQSSGSKRAKTVATVLATLGTAATLLFVFVQFWYTNQYLPAKNGAALALTADLNELRLADQRSGFRVFAAKLTIKNISSTKTQILASLYTVSGVEVAKANASAEAFFSRAAPNIQDREQLPIGRPTASRYSEEQAEDLVQFGEIFPEPWYLEPSEDYSGRIIVSVPKDAADSYEFLRLEMSVAVAKGNRLNPDYEGPVTYPPELVANVKRDHGRYIVSEWPIKPLSELDRITRGTFAYASVVNLSSREYPDSAVCIDQAERFKQLIDPEKVWDMCQTGDPLEAKLWQSYGVTGGAAVHDFGLTRSSEPMRPFTG
jgi:hypothetical protein